MAGVGKTEFRPQEEHREATGAPLGEKGDPDLPSPSMEEGGLCAGHCLVPPTPQLPKRHHHRSPQGSELTVPGRHLPLRVQICTPEQRLR